MAQNESKWGQNNKKETSFPLLACCVTCPHIAPSAVLNFSLSPLSLQITIEHWTPQSVLFCFNAQNHAPLSIIIDSPFTFTISINLQHHLHRPSSVPTPSFVLTQHHWITSYLQLLVPSPAFIDLVFSSLVCTVLSSISGLESSIALIWYKTFKFWFEI